MENNFDKLQEIAGINTKLNQFAKLANPIPENIKQIIEMQDKLKLAIPTFDFPKVDFPKMDFPKFDFPKFDFPNFVLPKIEIPKFDNLFNDKFLEALKQISKIPERIKNNPELQFGFISDLEILNLRSAEELKNSLISDLTDIDIEEKEEILNDNLIPYLENHNLENLWIGAGQVLESENNPDRLRQCLISLRTILEYLIDEKLAPLEKLKDAEMFESNFRKYHLGKQRIELVKIKREQKIEYFTSKFEYGMLEDFTKNEIQYVCNCYTILCNVHQPNIGLTENQVRSLKVKTGITVWLLVYLYDILEE
ncbi:hypothetical protein [uncultured Flavobacterium sp.]|uniref:pPIWI-associating nuclease domain-containing protein n=1 Tax=uncultured Flavobacterium sp. TaxID=165435 RepID=UPI00308176F9